MAADSKQDNIAFLHDTIFQNQQNHSNLQLMKHLRKGFSASGAPLQAVNSGLRVAIKQDRAKREKSQADPSSMPVADDLGDQLLPLLSVLRPVQMMRVLTMVHHLLLRHQS